MAFSVERGSLRLMVHVQALVSIMSYSSKRAKSGHTMLLGQPEVPVPRQSYGLLYVCDQFHVLLTCFSKLAICRNHHLRM